ncbi:hypothetical protein PT974_04426 [Cladobotryum mycophilum]|uniref:Uncharacterized protein n=1 Tax=Cladobotryum mycophilum TaxID=491253 RepID=A0ABR0SV52_9HYPO
MSPSYYSSPEASGPYNHPDNQDTFMGSVGYSHGFVREQMNHKNGGRVELQPEPMDHEPEPLEPLFGLDRYLENLDLSSAPAMPCKGDTFVYDPVLDTTLDLKQETSTLSKPFHGKRIRSARGSWANHKAFRANNDILLTRAINTKQPTRSVSNHVSECIELMLKNDIIVRLKKGHKSNNSGWNWRAPRCVA